MELHLITIFPHIFESYLHESIIGRAIKAKKIRVFVHDLKKFSGNKHNRLDDRPYGGGPGMVMQVGPIVRALRSIVKRKSASTRILLTSAKGTPLTQQRVRNYAKLKKIVIICGHYEGVDERVVSYVDEEISIGPYVMTGGELAALVVLDTVTRLQSGVVGDASSTVDESHEKPGEVEYPQYTRPEVFEKKSVPKILLSGSHVGIAAWRKSQKKKI